MNILFCRQRIQLKWNEHEKRNRKENSTYPFHVSCFAERLTASNTFRTALPLPSHTTPVNYLHHIALPSSRELTSPKPPVRFLKESDLIRFQFDTGGPHFMSVSCRVMFHFVSMLQDFVSKLINTHGAAGSNTKKSKFSVAWTRYYLVIYLRV